MKTSLRIGLAALLGLGLALVSGVRAAGAESAGAAATNAPAKAALPRLVDLGANKCIPCKMMAPILEELKKEYKGRMEVEFIDVWKDPNAGKAFNIKLIPTQIFFDATGKELFRHQGFFAKKDILAKWKELGVEFKSEGQKKSEGRSPKAEVPSGGAPSSKTEGK